MAISIGSTTAQTINLGWNTGSSMPNSLTSGVPKASDSYESGDSGNESRFGSIINSVRKTISPGSIAMLTNTLQYPFDTTTTAYSITSPFGTTATRANHLGVDFAMPVGTPILAAAGGKVTEAGWNGGYGNTVVIDHGSGLSTRYAHLDSINVKEGTIVAQGNQIGKSGNTGNSSGPHLHFEVKNNGTYVNPLDYNLVNNLVNLRAVPIPDVPKVPYSP